MAICKYCNHENAEGRKFCIHCGARLDQPTSQTPTTTSDSQQGSVPVAPIFPQSSSNFIPQEPKEEQGFNQEAGQPSLPAQPSQIPYGAQEGPNSKYVEPVNTVPFNEKDRQAYQEKLANPNRPDYENVCVLAFILSLVSIIFNPLLLSSLAAIILGIIGHANQGSKKALAKIGWIVGLITLVIRLVVYALIIYGIFTIARGLLLWF